MTRAIIFVNGLISDYTWLAQLPRADVPTDAVPDDVDTFVLTGPDDPVWLPGVLADAGLVTSNSEGRRMVTQGAVKIDGDTVETEDVARASVVDHVVQVGKRRFVRFLEG